MIDYIACKKLPVQKLLMRKWRFAHLKIAHNLNMCLDVVLPRASKECKAMYMAPVILT